MEVLAQAAATFALAALLIHLATTLSAVWRCGERRRPLPILDRMPPVTIIRPVCGRDHYDELTLRSSFELDHPKVEVLFCCASATDPVIPVVERLIAAHPHVMARLLIGDDKVSINPKLNNVIKGWRAASHDWILIADSNVLMPPDYLRRLVATWREDTGLVSSPPIGCHPSGIWAELECAFLNTYQARWQYAADTLGLGFAQGKILLWRRIDLERAGGIEALAAEVAEDAAATKAVRAQVLRVRLVNGACRQPLGVRTAGQVWGRQLRWARLRRSTFPAYFVLEVLSGVVPPLLALACAANELELDILPLLAAYAAVWVGAEAWLASAAGWPLSWRSPFLWLLRDLALPLLWAQSWFGNSLSWRGNEMTLAKSGGGWSTRAVRNMIGGAV